MTDGSLLDISSILIAAFVQQCSEPFNCGMRPIEDPSGEINTVFCEDGFAYLSPEPPDKLILPKFDRVVHIKSSSSQNKTNKNKKKNQHHNSPKKEMRQKEKQNIEETTKKEPLKNQKMEINEDDNMNHETKDNEENLNQETENIDENLNQEEESKEEKFYNKTESKDENINQEEENKDEKFDNETESKDKILNQEEENKEEKFDNETESKDEILNQETENINNETEIKKEENLNQKLEINEKESLNKAVEIIENITKKSEFDNKNDLEHESETKEENSNQRTEFKEMNDINQKLDTKEEEEDLNKETEITEKDNLEQETGTEITEKDNSEQETGTKDESLDQKIEFRVGELLNQDADKNEEESSNQKNEINDDDAINQDNEQRNEDNLTNESDIIIPNDEQKSEEEHEYDSNNEEEATEENQNDNNQEDDDTKKLRALTDELKSLTENVADITINEFNIEWGLIKGQPPYLINCDDSNFIFSDDLMPFSMYFNQILLFIGYESALTVTPGQCITPNKKCIGSQLSVNRQKFEIVQIQKYFQPIIRSNTNSNNNNNDNDIDEMEPTDFHSCTTENATLLSSDAADKLVQYIIKRLCGLFPQMMMSSVPCCSHCFRIYSRISLSSPTKSTKEAKKPRGQPKVNRYNYPQFRPSQSNPASFDRQSGYTASHTTQSTRAVERGRQTLMLTSPSRNQHLTRASQKDKSKTGNKKPSIVPATMFEPFQKTQSGLTVVQNISQETYKKSYKIYSRDPFPAFIQHT